MKWMQAELDKALAQLEQLEDRGRRR